MKHNVAKMFIALFIVVIFILAVAIFCFVNLFEKVLQNQLLMYCQMAIDCNVQYVNTISSTVKKIFDSLSFDSQISKLLNYDAVSASDINIGVQRLDSYMDSNVYVSSIYLYNREKGEVYVTSPYSAESVYSEIDFFDQDALSYMKDYSIYKNMEPIFREVSVTYPNTEEISYISFMRFNTLKSSNSSNVMMINVSMNVYSSLLRNLPENSGERFLFFTDTKGLCENISGYASFELSKKLVERLQDNYEESFMLEADGKNYIVCSQPVMNSDINITFVADKSEIGSMTEFKGFIYSVLILIVLFVLCIIFAFDIAKRIMRLIVSHKEEIAQLEKDKLELESLTKRRQILNFLTGNQDIKENAVDYEFLSDMDTLSVLCLVYINSYHSSVSVKYERTSDRNILKQNILDEAINIFGADRIKFSVFEEEEKCILCLKEKNEDCFEKFISLCCSKFEISLTLFISPQIAVSEIPNFYSELCEAIPSRILYEENIITSDMIDVRKMYNTKLPEEELKLLTYNIMQLNVDNALVNLRSILEEISSGSYKSFQMNFSMFAFYLDETLGKLQVNNGIEKVVYVDNVIYNLSQFESVEDIYYAFKEVILQSTKVISENKKGHQSNIILEMQDIIKKNYSSKDLSIITVSEMIGMNASYLGKLFKKGSGKTFIEFLHEVRMNEACNLLKNTDMEISDVVSEVGYSDIPYFYKMFKKMNGCTPLVYRQKNTTTTL